MTKWPRVINALCGRGQGEQMGLPSLKAGAIIRNAEHP